MLISIVIVAYKNGDELLNCLDSIESNNDLGDQLEVIIVDNSPDDTVENLLRGKTGFSYYNNPLNGFGRGNNVGLLKSSGRYVLFLNPDTLIMSSCFMKMVSVFEKDNSIGMMGFKLIDKNGQENNSYNMRLNYGILKKIVLKLSRRFHLFMHRVMYTCGADIFVERETFQQIGMFDENLFMYSEEEDIAYRMNRIGKRIAYEPSIVITHLQGQSTGHQNLRNRKVMAESTRYVCEKYGFSFNRQMKKEVRAMRIINFACHVIGKPQKYDKEIVDYYKSLSTKK